MKKSLKIPKFKNEQEEADFWNALDLTEYFEPGDFIPVSFPNLKPTTTPVTLRIPTYMLKELKDKAHSMDVPYQSLIKIAIKNLLESK